MKKTALLLFFVLAYGISATAQKEALNAIDRNDLQAYMEFFASDDMAGRETGTPQNDIAALFIRSNLKRLGLNPIPGTGDYLQALPMISTRIDRKSSYLKINDLNNGTAFTTDSVVSLMPSSSLMEVTGNVVFAGYGYVNQGKGYNDFEGIDIKGKIVIIMTRNPEAVKTGEGMKVFDEALESMKFSALMMRGPSAVLYVYDPQNTFKDAYKSGMADLIGQSTVTFKGRKTNSLPMQVMFITRNAADNLIKPTGYTLAQMQQKISAEGKPVSCEVKGLTATVRTAVETSDISAFNVIGIIEGSDPVLKNECVIYTAHFDHVGINRNGEVFNGADDNASGSMALLEVAEAFARLKEKPLRSVVFAWVNGEEKGLLGSSYYTENPVFPLDKTLADINLDMVGRSKMAADTGKFYGFDLDITNPGEINVFTAPENSELIKIMNTSAKEAGIKVNDLGPNIPYGSSDHASFVARKVPALCFNSGIHSDLHKPGDDVEKIDFDKMEKSAKMCFLIGYRVANQQKRITAGKAQ